MHTVSLTDMSKWKFESSSAQDTEEFGIKLAERLKGGEILELLSDLGGGKTTFARGLARGLGIEGDITSPTFVISKVYKGDNLEMHHYDFYRLDEAGLMEEEIQDVIENHKNVTVVEWAGSTHDLFPEERLIKVELRPMEDENAREITIIINEALDIDLESIGAEKC